MKCGCGVCGQDSWRWESCGHVSCGRPAMYGELWTASHVRWSCGRNGVRYIGWPQGSVMECHLPPWVFETVTKKTKPEGVASTRRCVYRHKLVVWSGRSVLVCTRQNTGELVSQTTSQNKKLWQSQTPSARKRMTDESKEVRLRVNIKTPTEAPVSRKQHRWETVVRNFLSCYEIQRIIWNSETIIEQSNL